MECIKQHVARVCSMLDAQVTVSAAGKAACHVPLHVSSSQQWGGSEQERVLATLQSLCAEVQSRRRLRCLTLSCWRCCRGPGRWCFQPCRVKRWKVWRDDERFRLEAQCWVHRCVAPCAVIRWLLYALACVPYMHSMLRICVLRLKAASSRRQGAESGKGSSRSSRDDLGMGCRLKRVAAEWR